MKNIFKEKQDTKNQQQFSQKISIIQTKKMNLDAQIEDQGRFRKKLRTIIVNI